MPAADVAVRNWVHRHQRGSLAELSLALTQAGSPAVSVVVLLVVAALLGVRRRSYLPLLFAITATCSVAFAVLPIKGLVDRPGPALMHRRLATGYFPSGHTATAFVCYGAAAAIVGAGVARPGKPRPCVVGIGAAVPVGAAMVYSNFHWLSDVLASLALGTVLVEMLTTLSRYMLPLAPSTQQRFRTVIRPRPPKES